jgi:hypothetical protein
MKRLDSDMELKFILAKHPELEERLKNHEEVACLHVLHDADDNDTKAIFVCKDEIISSLHTKSDEGINENAQIFICAIMAISKAAIDMEIKTGKPLRRLVNEFLKQHAESVDVL